MNIVRTKLDGVLLLEPHVYEDDRGYVYEPYNRAQLLKATGVDMDFVLNSEIVSKQAVLRGLSYQINPPRARLARAVDGEIFSVVVDVRKSSKTFGAWVSQTLSASNKKQILIPFGCAHGYLTTSKQSTVHEMSTAYFDPAVEEIIRCDDPRLSISWPLIPYEYPIALSPHISRKTMCGKYFDDAVYFD